jgi:hypothetical protein
MLHLVGDSFVLDQREVIMCIGLHVKYRIFFSEVLKNQISWKSFELERRCSMRTGRQTGQKHEETNSRFSLILRTRLKPQLKPKWYCSVYWVKLISIWSSNFFSTTSKTLLKRSEAPFRGGGEGKVWWSSNPSDKKKAYIILAGEL